MESDSVEFEYNYSDGYKLAGVNGAHGGITPRGDFVIEFFAEASMVPDSIKHALNDDGSLGEILETKAPSAKMQRRIQTGVILSLKNAKLIASWMQERIKEHESALEDLQGGE
jgi:hypothetical protein